MPVAPFAGAWIEISWHVRVAAVKIVAPFAGAWIEIDKHKRIFKTLRVAPFAGAWIEIKNNSIRVYSYDSRTLRGCVD